MPIKTPPMPTRAPAGQDDLTLKTKIGTEVQASNMSPSGTLTTRFYWMKTWSKYDQKTTQKKSWSLIHKILKKLISVFFSWSINQKQDDLPSFFTTRAARRVMTTMNSCQRGALGSRPDQDAEDAEETGKQEDQSE